MNDGIDADDADQKNNQGIADYQSVENCKFQYQAS
jgi:hypothetical protein